MGNGKLAEPFHIDYKSPLVMRHETPSGKTLW